MKKATKKAGIAVSLTLAVFAAATPLIVAAQSNKFALGDLKIQNETVETVATEEVSETTPEPVEAAEPLATEPEQVVVTVQSGDSLSKLASAHGVTWKRLYDANASIADPNVINPGTQLRIPRADEVLAERALPAVKAVATNTSASKKSTSSTNAAPAARISNDGSVWSQLAMCESGGRVNAVSSNGKYHGLYQFLPSTWRAVGGSGLPSQASAEEQTMRAQMLQARSGWGQWPACARKLGLI